MATRNGIYHELGNTPYVLILEGLKYHFSSRLHMRKFKAGYLKNRDEISDRLFVRYRTNFKVKIMADLIFYEKIESRGFLVQLEKGEAKCQKQLILGSEQVVTLLCEAQHEILTSKEEGK